MKRNKIIDEFTEKLFSINYFNDETTDELLEEYSDLARHTLAQNSWDMVFNSWYEYLLQKCEAVEEIINFANLLWIYIVDLSFKKRPINHRVPDPTKIIAYLIFKIDIRMYPETEPVIEGIAIKLFEFSRLKKKSELYDYSPFADETVMDIVKMLNE